MFRERMIVLIREYNPWWEGKEIEVPEYRRHIFREIKGYLDKKQIIAITGLRRVGKTILMRQMISDLFRKENPKNIFYFLFDDILSQNPEVLEDVIRYYLNTVAGKGRKYIFLDEIQKVPYWRDVLKRFYDTREDIKFIISGSSSLQIKKSKESLAGRIFDFYMPVLSFKEFLELKGITTENMGFNFRKMEGFYERNIHKKEMFESLLEEYIFKGAFPELVREEEEEIIRNYIKNSVIEKIVFEDIPSVFGVKRRDVLSSVLEYSSRETANLLDIKNLSSVLGVNYHTLKSHIFYLQNSFVIDILYNYSKSISKQLRKNKKLHIVHPSVGISVLGYSRDSLGGEMLGRFVETMVFQHMKNLSKRIFFWRTPQKDEVDVVVEDGKPIPIEVKYKTAIAPKDLKSMVKFMKRFGVKEGFLVTKTAMEKKEVEGRRIFLVPGWVFLMISKTGKTSK